MQGPARKGFRTVAAVFAAAVLAVVTLFVIPWQIVLVVRQTETGRDVLRIPMDDGEEFVLSYVHSVNRRPVYDSLRVEGRGLRILRSRFDAFGAGMPEISTDDQPLRTGPDGWLEYTVNRPVSEVTLFVGRIARHALHCKGRAVALTDLAEPGTSLQFLVAKQSLFDRWKGRQSWHKTRRNGT